MTQGTKGDNGQALPAGEEDPCIFRLTTRTRFVLIFNSVPHRSPHRASLGFMQVGLCHTTRSPLAPPPPLLSPVLKGAPAPLEPTHKLVHHADPGQGLDDPPFLPPIGP